MNEIREYFDFDDLEKETVLRLVFDKLDEKSLLAAAQTSKTFNTIARQSMLESNTWAGHRSKTLINLKRLAYVFLDNKAKYSPSRLKFIVDVQEEAACLIKWMKLIVVNAREVEKELFKIFSKIDGLDVLELSVFSAHAMFTWEALYRIPKVQELKIIFLNPLPFSRYFLSCRFHNRYLNCKKLVISCDIHHTCLKSLEYVADIKNEVIEELELEFGKSWTPCEIVLLIGHVPKLARLTLVGGLDFDYSDDTNFLARLLIMIDEREICLDLKDLRCSEWLEDANADDENDSKNIATDRNNNYFFNDYTFVYKKLTIICQYELYQALKFMLKYEI